MDDIVDSRSGTEEVARLTSEIDQVLTTGHFETNDWISSVALSQNDSTLTEEKVQAIRWNREKDVLSN